MDRHELLTGFIRENLAVLTQPTLPPKLYKTNKHDYFVTRHADSRQGVPRDTEIANEVVWFLIRHGQVKTKEDLERFLSRGLLAEKVFDPQVFYEFLDINKPAEPLIDFKKIRQTEFLDSIREQIRNELRKEMTLDRVIDIEKEIQRKLAEYEALPSVIDAKEYALPAKPPEEADTEENLEWWQRLHLTSDPFPATEGLFKIKPESYDAVVVKTKIFQKYIKYMETTPAEIFKNTIFFGEFGSGKTTLFQYLRKALETHKIYSVYVHLSFEKDFQSLKIVFKEKLVTELRSLIGDDELARRQEFGDVDVALTGLMNRLDQKLKPRGLVVFIDDLNKSREGYPVALEFLSYLQVFTYEMAEKITLENIGFYVAGALEWEPTVRTQPRYSGSLARPEIIPDITEEEAWMMLNKRLEAYYPNPELKREVDRGFVSQVYRDLKTNKLELTFRRFIRRLVAEFKASNFKVLVSDPVHIPPETLLGPYPQREI
jgi:DNA replication protein DnaC